MMKIYHNPRCRKSREGLQVLRESGEPFETILYLENPPSREELLTIVSKLDISPIELVRKNEAFWKENYRGKEMDEAKIIDAMVQYPKLIERPIVIKGSKAAIGRPLKNISELLNR